MIEIFPFDLIEKGSTILLYGLGRCGRVYIEQNKQLGWCNIKYVSDKEKPAEEFKELYIKPEDISNVIETIDKIVIAISHPVIVKQVKGWLIKRGIDKNIIVNALLKDDLMINQLIWVNLEKGRKSKILIIMIGGLGDYIVYLSFYQRLIEYVPDAEIVIQGRTILLDAVYGQKENTTIVSENLPIKDSSEFDCILELNHFIKVVRYNPVRLPDILIRKLEAYEAEYERKYSIHEMVDGLFVRRMIIGGRNRYDALGGGSIFKLGTVKLKIEYTEEAERSFKKYNLKQYVTFNIGSDRLRKTEKEQMKVWPKELYIEWIDRFRKQYPDLDVIQIGAKDASIIDGADRYILGESFEVIKYILKNAVFHLDCEGGLVHLATAIGTKCIVFFGPTPLEYYAYPQNVNLCTNVCEGCMGLSDNWYYECIHSNKQYCMYSITPEMIMETIKNMDMKGKY